tara:strand:+ start:5035 stop:6039 length:1005 start_codon:yes stop_codon:yes gene_type:complete
MKSNFIAVAVGDIKGIGLELLINSLKEKKINNFVLFTNLQILKKHIKKRKIDIKINIVNKIENNFDYLYDKLNIYNFKSKSEVDNTIKSLIYTYKHTISGKYIGVLTLPLRKDLIIKNNKKFIGQTEFFQQIDNKKNSNMILVHNKLIVSTLTTHIKVNKIINTIKKNNFIVDKLKSLNNTLINDFNISSPNIIISGVNPHAGENGLIGNEENLILKPGIKKAQKLGIQVTGPFSADSILNKSNIKKYDCFVFIYHDQALTTFKYISNFSGVNYTGNLSIIRTSPDHGTAYNLRGSNKASNKSLIECFKLIKFISKNRVNVKTKKIIKSKFFKR